MSEIMDEIAGLSGEIGRPAQEGVDAAPILKSLIDHKFDAHQRRVLRITPLTRNSESYYQTQELCLRQLGGLSINCLRLVRHLGEAEDEDYIDYRVDSAEGRRTFSRSPGRFRWSTEFSIDQDGNIQDRRTGQPARPMKKAGLYASILLSRPGRRR